MIFITSSKGDRYYPCDTIISSFESYEIWKSFRELLQKMHFEILSSKLWNFAAFQCDLEQVKYFIDGTDLLSRGFDIQCKSGMINIVTYRGSDFNYLFLLHFWFLSFQDRNLRSSEYSYHIKFIVVSWVYVLIMSVFMLVI